MVQGSIETETWEKDCHKRTSVYVMVDAFEFCGGKKNSGGGQLAHRQTMTISRLRGDHDRNGG